MNLIEAMKRNNTVKNTKNGEYFKTSYDSNLDLFAMLSRYNSYDDVIRMFNNAYDEDSELALANLLYLLDIRNGKGERRLFKIIFRDLCNKHSNDALRILPLIGDLGRYDYILEGLDTPIEKDVISLIKETLIDDMNTENPSLLAKWLPSHRTHKKNSMVAKKIMSSLNMQEKDYRKMLSMLRSKINIVEKNLTEKQYDNIVFSEVPTKALMKYRQAFNTRMAEKYNDYKESVKRGLDSINTEGLFAYEIINKISRGRTCDDELLDLMWKNQKNVLQGCDANVLVMADTSGSMTMYDGIPFATAIGLALYTSERNEGIFKNHFITFSSDPYLCEIKGNTIREKVNNIPCIIENTDIDKAFELILKSAKQNKLKQKELPSHLLIISDMEFDQGVYSKNGTNFEGWKKTFDKNGYKLPTVIFWNVAGSSYGIPATKFDKDVAMISGFSTNILENLFTLEKYTPSNMMLEKLSIYLELLKIRRQF